MTDVLDRPSAIETRPAERGLAHLLADLALAPGVPVAVRAYDGSRAGPADAVATVVVRRPEAISRFLTAPGQLGAARAYVAGDVDVEGDLLAAVRAVASAPPRPTRGVLVELARHGGPRVLRPIAPPAEEANLTGRLHSKARDRAAIAHHYDVSNDFYRLLLGPSLTYSCALWRQPDVGLDAAQEAKHELVCRKLGLEPGDRLLDVGCGWGSTAIHAARHHGAHVVAVTLSERQAELARERVGDAGLADLVEVRLQDYRDIDDAPFDAISSIGMFEHVGRARLAEYFQRLHDLIRPGGRLLNHGITRRAQAHDDWPVQPHAPWRKRTFIDRYVFPDGELHELGTVVTALQQQGFEARHVENLREHYALTLERWVHHLEGRWSEAVEMVGEARARIWRLYLSISTVGFEIGHLQIHQILAVKADRGRSGMPLRPVFE
jgi:cyclopropane-fatty-acyl-phospholipid synthase